jgi:hypothetical protein
VRSRSGGGEPSGKRRGGSNGRYRRQAESRGPRRWCSCQVRLCDRMRNRIFDILTWCDMIPSNGIQASHFAVILFSGCFQLFALLLLRMPSFEKEISKPAEMTSCCSSAGCGSASAAKEVEAIGGGKCCAPSSPATSESPMEEKLADECSEGDRCDGEPFDPRLSLARY